MSFQWYALHVKPNKERIVNERLIARDVAVFYPALKRQPINPRARKERPFFPGYLFVYLDLDELGANALRWTEGTYGLVEFGGEPATVPNLLISELKTRIKEIQLTGESPQDEVKAGDIVRIVDGPFDGYEAIFDTRLSAKDRIQVMLTYLRAQPKKIQLNRSEIEKIHR